MLYKFDFVLKWDSHQGRINIAKHLIEQSSADASPINSASYQPDRKAGEFEKIEIEKMLSERVIEPA